ncbi:cytoglobin [Plakobranchus ocellatus]|uniref:Globin n=1 Tax=Plakobranchus ocellatus TaxID=259542 RepID=A0AAV4C8H7_9GAST|nr:cytoglobin [Plakobranchus ocellatus]
MGNLFSCWSGDDKVTRPSDQAPQGLSVADVSYIKSTMNKLYKNGQLLDFGMKVFKDLFTTYPYTRDWFPAYHTSPNEMEQDDNMIALVVIVMHTLRSYVDYCHEEETLEGLVEKMARFHLKRYVTTVDMEIFSSCVIRQLKKLLGIEFNAKQEKAWTKFFALHNKVYGRIETEWLDPLSHLSVTDVTETETEVNKKAQ